MRVLFFVPLAVLAIVVGCSSSDNGPDFEVAPNGDGDAAAGDADTQTPGRGGGDGSTASGNGLSGKLAASEEASFGGVCEYSMKMTDIVVDVTLVDGSITSATVGSTMVETLESACDTDSIAPNPHDFALDGAVDVSALADGETKTLMMLPTHDANPPSTLSFEIVKKGDGYDANLRWERHDEQDEGYKWKTSATLSLEKSP